MQTILGIILCLHGLVHLWYVTLSRGWVDFQADMGWTGHSWILTNTLGSDITRGLATLLYSLATVSFTVAGIGLLANQDWARTGMIIASLISAGTILVFWDGSFKMLVEKGVIGFLISLGILGAAVFLK
jgi:hypothetical protein